MGKEGGKEKAPTHKAETKNGSAGRDSGEMGGIRGWADTTAKQLEGFRQEMGGLCVL